MSRAALERRSRQEAAGEAAEAEETYRAALEARMGIGRGRPEDHGDRVDGFMDRKGRRRPVDRSRRVQFFTDKEGRVHPIRDTEPASERHDSGRSGSRHYVNAYGERVDWTPSYDPDEAF